MNLLMQQTRPYEGHAPLARPPSWVQAPLSAQIPVSLLGDVQLVKGKNAGKVLAITAANRSMICDLIIFEIANNCSVTW